ncbi:serine/threonine protein kinase [Lutimonas sp.]|uniref:serine/threonine protein kinase n=1 Tax=Lutimonas sp. TaxID=1872403 RepID=UPI003D9B429E
MNIENKQRVNKFLQKWVIANGIGYFVGVVSSIILSHLVVNIFYSKETNLIVGLCIGASVGYAQWFILKGMFKLSSLWGLVCTACLGIPFIAFVIMDEYGYKFSSFHEDYEFLNRLLFGLLIGLLIGLLQMQFLKPYFKKAAWWIAACSVGWGICFLLSSFPMPFSLLGLLVGGVSLGIVTGYTIVWMNKYSNIIMS